VENLRESDQLKHLGVDGRIILKWIFRNSRGAWTLFIWLRIRTDRGLLWTRLWTFGFHKMQGISWLAEELLSSEAGVCSMELITLSTQLPAIIISNKTKN
jgi:hypothetical protein